MYKTCIICVLSFKLQLPQVLAAKWRGLGSRAARCQQRRALAKPRIRRTEITYLRVFKLPLDIPDCLNIVLL